MSQLAVSSKHSESFDDVSDDENAFATFLIHAHNYVHVLRMLNRNLHVSKVIH